MSTLEAELLREGSGCCINGRSLGFNGLDGRGNRNNIESIGTQLFRLCACHILGRIVDIDTVRWIRGDTVAIQYRYDEVSGQWM